MSETKEKRSRTPEQGQKKDAFLNSRVIVKFLFKVRWFFFVAFTSIYYIFFH